MAGKLCYLSSFEPGGVTCDREKGEEVEGGKKKKSLSAAMSKASVFTEQLGVSSPRSDVRIYYGSTTANCLKVKVTDLTAL